VTCDDKYRSAKLQIIDVPSEQDCVDGIVKIVDTNVNFDTLRIRYENGIDHRCRDGNGKGHGH
jgi:hypothetical protein